MIHCRIPFSLRIYLVNGRGSSLLGNFAFTLVFMQYDNQAVLIIPLGRALLTPVSAALIHSNGPVKNA